MVVKKSSAETGPSSLPVPVHVETLPGCADEDVVRCLEAAGAGRISVLARGFVSAELSPAKFADLEHLAIVRVKNAKRPT